MKLERGSRPGKDSVSTLPTPLPPELGSENGRGHATAERSAVRTNGWLHGNGVQSHAAAETFERIRTPHRSHDRGWLVRRGLLVADVAGLCVTFLAVKLVFGSSFQLGDAYNALAELSLFLATIPLWIAAAKLHGLYDRDEERADATTADDLSGVVQLITLGTWIVFALGSLSGLGDPRVGEFVVFWGLAILLVTLGRAGARAFCRRQPAYLQNVLVIGAGEIGQQVALKLLQHPEYGINLLGFVDDEPREPRYELTGIPVLGSPDDLTDLIRSLDVDRVIIAFSGETHDETLKLMRMLNEFDLRIDVVPRLFENMPPSVNVHMLEGLTLLGLPRPRLSRSSRLLKRALDVVLTTALLIVLAPLLAAIAVVIKVGSRGPVFFRQTRVGFGGKPFVILKFRTMVVDAEQRKQQVAHLNKHARPGGDPRMFKIPDDPRRTRVGRILRRYSLDELPQLYNVLRGEMSLVGPRPLIPEEHGFLVDWGLRRLDLRPGMTGLWQVLGRDGIGFDEMVRLDYFYVTTWSLWNDIRLLLRTFAVIAKGERPPPSFPPAAFEL
jgi:exopolysaccharide biosynthesis polyprenyl glycosylphosphotransferase